jgi:peptide deformylase
MKKMLSNNLRLVSSEHELLSAKLPTFDFNNPVVDPKELVNKLSEIMKDKNGLGLAANQIGLPYRVFVLNTDPVTACFNPRIIEMSDKMIVSQEGCLTYPYFFVKIARPGAIKVRYADVNGEFVTRTLSGISARAFLHEYDHLEGINYLDRAKPYHLDQAKRQTKIFKRKLKRLNNGNKFTG